MPTAEYWIKKLELQPHPEGGYFREIYRNPLQTTVSGAARSMATSIFFLLDSRGKSHFHRLRSDELWYYHQGDPLTLCMFDKQGTYHEKMLGPDPERGQELQIIIPAETIFGAYVPSPGEYTLMGCMVNPGFDFTDFEVLLEDELYTQFPNQFAEKQYLKDLVMRN